MKTNSAWSESNLIQSISSLVLKRIVGVSSVRSSSEFFGYFHNISYNQTIISKNTWMEKYFEMNKMTSQNLTVLDLGYKINAGEGYYAVRTIRTRISVDYIT